MSNELVEKVARAIAEASNYDLAYTSCKQYAVAALSAIQQDTVAGEVGRETYRQMHETALELGYPSILEALEGLDRLKSECLFRFKVSKPQAREMIGANGQIVDLLSIGGRVVEVDTEIAPIVRALNAAGLPTRASCSGHGYRPASIILRDGREIIIARDYAEARQIDALFPLNINGESNHRDTEHG